MCFLNHHQQTRTQVDPELSLFHFNVRAGLRFDSLIVRENIKTPAREDVNRTWTLQLSFCPICWRVEERLITIVENITSKEFVLSCLARKV